jgi:glutamate--cysteine ligase
MDTKEQRELVAGLFARGRRRTTRVAVEQEFITTDLSTGAPARTLLVRQAAALQSPLAEPVRRRTASPDSTIKPVRRLAASADPVLGIAAAYLGFEPGGQVELSLPCVAGSAELAQLLRLVTDDLQTRLGAAGIRLDAIPCDPRPDVPLQLTSPRYLAMQRHFDTIGPAGRRMMRRTASTQVCLDWWPGSAGAEQWRLLNLAAPFLAAAFARSTGPDGRLTTWLAVDPDRTGFDDRLLHGDPTAAYASFAAGATAFTTGPAEHLTTLFPPVRPRATYLEVRFLDAQEPSEVQQVVATLENLMYDDDLRRRTLRALESELPHLADHWRAAAAGDPGITSRGRELAQLATLELVA